MRSVGVGIIGCGNISPAYLKAAKTFPILTIKGVADLNPAAAEARGAEFGVPAMSIEALLGHPDIEIVLNLTIPAAHVEVGLKILKAGKHVYSEKPLGIDFADASRLVDEATQRGLRLGCAPDTFLGGGHQEAREFLDAGQLGQLIGGSAFFMCPGHERWHPAPDFYYKRGGGPMLDMGPYYVTNLVNLYGPVARVAGMSPKPRLTRTIGSEPRRGQTIEVEIPTHVVGMLEFHSGPVVSITMSFDVAGHRHTPIELYGAEGSLLVPDPNRFGGEVLFLPKGGEWTAISIERPYADGNYRSLGLADMAAAIRQDRPHRASAELALHVLEVMEGVGRAAESCSIIDMTTRAERPQPLSESPPFDK